MKIAVERGDFFPGIEALVPAVCGLGGRMRGLAGGERITRQRLSFQFLNTDECKPLQDRAISSCRTSAASGRNLLSLGVLRIAVSPSKILSAILRTHLH